MNIKELNKRGLLSNRVSDVRKLSIELRKKLNDTHSTEEAVKVAKSFLKDSDPVQAVTCIVDVMSKIIDTWQFRQKVKATRVQDANNQTKMRKYHTPRGGMKSNSQLKYLTEEDSFPLRKRDSASPTHTKVKKGSPKNDGGRSSKKPTMPALEHQVKFPDSYRYLARQRRFRIQDDDQSIMIQNFLDAAAGVDVSFNLYGFQIDVIPIEEGFSVAVDSETIGDYLSGEEDMAAVDLQEFLNSSSSMEADWDANDPVTNPIGEGFLNPVWEEADYGAYDDLDYAY